MSVSSSGEHFGPIYGLDLMLKSMFYTFTLFCYHSFHIARLMTNVFPAF